MGDVHGRSYSVDTDELIDGARRFTRLSGEVPTTYPLLPSAGDYGAASLETAARRFSHTWSGAQGVTIRNLEATADNLRRCADDYERAEGTALELLDVGVPLDMG